MGIIAGDKKMTEENIDFVEVDEVEEFNTLEELQPQFIRSPKVGEKVDFVCKGFKIVKEKSDLEFSFEKNGKQKTASNALSSVDYGIQIITQEGAIFWINSWSVFGQIKAIMKKLNNNSLAGVELEIDHALNGMVEENRDKQCWIVKAKVDGEFKKLNKDSKEWE